MDSSWMMIITLLIMLPVIVITTIIPYLTRRIESFGVTIPEVAQRDPHIVVLKKQYLIFNSILGVVVIISLSLITWFVQSETAWAVWLTVHLFGYMILSFVIYLKQHRAVKQYKLEQQWSTEHAQRIVIDTTFRKRNITISYYWFIPHIVIVVITALVGVLNYAQFPDIIPMKYSMNGEVINSAIKSYSTVLWPVMTQCVLLVLFIFVHYTFSRSKQLVESSDPENSLQRNIIFRRRWSIFMMMSSFLLVALFLFIEFSLFYSWTGNEQTIAPLVVIAFILIGAIILSITTGQGGSRIKLNNGVPATTLTTADHDQHWKMGVFYFNREDPAIFVEKRFGVGMTMNCARPLGWLILLGIIALPLLIMLFI
ncbi:DUF1648 domain-containing protein [Paenibacillus yanchengensis]|uniref:DUF1648 domain-containing protein n=1 Tax=Paenibacillus yanchengensis TaxID=2035833 RepID=A0ABW4YJ93_9BACL